MLIETNRLEIIKDNVSEIGWFTYSPSIKTGENKIKTAT